MDQSAINEAIPSPPQKKPDWSLRISKILLVTSFFSCSLGLIATLSNFQLPYILFQLQFKLIIVFGYLVFSSLNVITIPLYVIAFFLLARGTKGKTRLWVLGAFVLTPIIAIGAIVDGQFSPLQTVSMGSKNYHLASYNSQAVPFCAGWWHYQYGMYECDWFDIICQRLYETDDSWMGNETLDLVPDYTANTISLVIDHEVVYTHHVE